MSKTTKRILLLAVTALLIWFVYDAFNQPGVQDLKGGFDETAVYRNENNTGPVIRVYAVTVADTSGAELEEYGNFMPHTKYGNTKVYFFRKGGAVPKEVFPGDQSFPETFNANLVAKYEKDAMGNVTFRRF